MPVCDHHIYSITSIVIDCAQIRFRSVTNTCRLGKKPPRPQNLLTRKAFFESKTFNKMLIYQGNNFKHTQTRPDSLKIACEWGNTV